MVKKKKTRTTTNTSTKKKTKTKNGFILSNDDIDIHAYNYDVQNAESFVNNKMGIFGYNINLERALPNVRDGLKPVQRVILYTGFKHGFRDKDQFKKSLRFIGAGSTYYVHGDASFYEAMMSLGKDFYIKYPLINVHGNVGSISGDGAAAQRYTESKLSKFTESMLSNFNEASVDWKPNYDGTEKQPTVLPVIYPNLLLNGCFGIGQGFIGSIPSHNFKDIADRVISYIKNPDIDIDELIGDLIPDYPTGGVIINKSDLKIIYKTGNDPDKLIQCGYNKDGKSIPIRIRGKIEENKKGNLVIKSIPYMKNTGSVLDSIQTAIKDGRIDGISAIKDDTNKDNGVNIELIIKRGHDPKVVENQIYKNTILQDSIATQFLCTTPDMLNFRYYNLKEMIEEWVTATKTSMKRVINSEISVIKRKIHIDEGLLIALDPNNLDEVINTIRSSKTESDAEKELIKKFGLTEIQADNITSYRLGALANMEIEKVKEDYEKQKENLEEKISYFKDKNKLDNTIIENLEKGIKLYNQPKITEAIDVDLSNMEEATIENSEHVIFITSEGFIKKIESSKIKTQNAKGQGINVGKLKDGDYIINTLNVENLNDILFFTNKGRLLKLKAYEIKDSNINSYGILLNTLLNLKEGEKVVQSMKSDGTEANDDSFLLFATRNGLIKKTEYALYKNVPKSGFAAIDLNEDDELIKVSFVKFDMDVIVSTEQGSVIRYSTKSIPSTKRTTKGVKSICLDENDKVVSFDLLEKDSDSLLVVTNKGNAKRIIVKSIPPTERTKKVRPLTKLVNGEKVISSFFVDEKDEVTMVGTKKVIKIPVSQIPVLIRNASCKKVISLGKGEKLLVCTK